jgi:signal peptidase I
MRLRCEECGYQFDVNYPSSGRDDNLAIPASTPLVYAMHCPNCGKKVARKAREARSAEHVPVHYGDRILVLKYIYLLNKPQRWDVVVFKTPTTDLSGKPELNYTQNFIKRLVGLPGEELMLLDGDVYTRLPGEGKDHWQIQRKDAAAQAALWRIVYDNDFQPRAAAGRTWKNFWQPSGGWEETGKGRVHQFDGLTSGASGTLTFDRSANPASGTFPLTDWLPYNETGKVDTRESGAGADYYDKEAYGLRKDGREEDMPRWYVSDLKLQFTYTREAGDGALEARLTKLGRTFVASFTRERVQLVEEGEPGKTLSVSLGSAGSGPMNVEFSNVDYALSVKVNGRELIRREYSPDLDDLLERHRRRRAAGTNRQESREAFPEPRVSLAAAGQRCSVAHLSLWRDVYYTPLTGNGSIEFWGSGPERPIRLRRKGEALEKPGKGGENEYFVLGDNSILSGDARGWETDVDLRRGEDLYIESGRIPERFLLGRAFFVYWPAGYRPLYEGAPGVVPNFGEMRFIH